MNLKEVTKQEAQTLFNNNIVIYIQAEDINLKPESYNTFSLSAKTWDGSLNIYNRGLTPFEYGFNEIITWINERVNTIPKFYTFNSNEFLIIENN